MEIAEVLIAVIFFKITEITYNPKNYAWRLYEEKTVKEKKYRLKARYFLWVLFLAILSYPLESMALNIEFTNYNVIDFGTMNRGAIKDDIPTDGLVVRCTTGPATPGWTLKIKSEYPLTHESNPASMIPNTYFKWYGERTSDADNNSLVTMREDFTFEKTVYTGAAGEDQTDITLKFELTLPRDIQWGTYNTNHGRIVFTLTE